MPPKKGAAALPAKERTLFTRLVQEYELKKFKVAGKTADLILKKFPDHGETLSMKGLVLGSLGNPTEGLELARKGLRADLGSFLSWHAMGILNRLVKNYQESVKSYVQALRIAPTDSNMLREVGLLYMQLRNYDQLLPIRLEMIQMMPHVRQYWASLAVTQHLMGNLEQASRVLFEFDKACREIPDKSFEHSEMVLYRASILEELEQWKKLDLWLTDKSNRIVDRKAADEIRGRALIELGEHSKAENIFVSLLRRNSEQHSYLEGFLRSRGVTLKSTTEEEQDRAGKCLLELQTRYPKSRAAKRLALTYLSGTTEAFRTQASAYLLNAFQKGIPSLFFDLKPLYKDAAKVRVIEEVVTGFLEAWGKSEADQDEETPSCTLWALLYLAQHHSILCRSSQALATITLAEGHSPTLPEIAYTRARILKSAGDVFAAAEAMQDARLLDGQDRFVNSKAVKYTLRAGQVDEAVRLVGLFTRPDAPSPVQDLTDMQALWYLQEEARAHDLIGDLGMALKRLHTIDQISQNIADEILDFHSYVMRTWTLRGYIEMIRWTDNIRASKAFRKAAGRAVRIYLRIFDDPTLKEPKVEAAPVEEQTEDTSSMTDEERKAYKKAKRAEHRAAEEAAAKKKAEEAAAAAAAAAAKKKATTSNGEEDDSVPPVAVDKDPQGLALLRTEEPLTQAERFLRHLQAHSAEEPETWTLTYDVAERAKNWLLAVRALNKLRALSAAATSSGRDAVAIDAELHVRILRLLKRIPEPETAPEGAIRAALLAGLKEQGVAQGDEGGVSAAYVQNATSELGLLAAARGVQELRGQEGVEEVDGLLQRLLSIERVSLPNLTAASEILQSLSSPSLANFRSSAHALYPLARVFRADEQQEDLKRGVLEARSRWGERGVDEKEDGSEA